MSIYTVRRIKGNQRPHPDFKAKGLDTLHPCSLSNCEIYGVPHKRQIAYAAYVHSISAFLFATEKQVRVSVDAEGYPIKLASDKVLGTFNLPPLGVSFKKKPSVDKITEMENQYGMRFVKNMGQEIYIIDNSSLAVAKAMVEQDSIRDARTPSGVANLFGFQSYLHCMKVVTLFCSTHTYPAFSTPLSDPGTIHNFAADSEVRILRDVAPVNNKRRKVLPEVATDEGMDEDEDVAEITDDLRVAVNLQESVLNAKPAPFYPYINFGPVSAVPVASGLVFPYFYQMITPDYQIIPDIMREFFLQTFGSTRSEVIAGFQRWAQYSKTWVESPMGLEMGHIFYGIKLALQSQTRVYFIREHERYLGFVLLGEGFSIVAQDGEFLPVSAEEVREQLSKVSFHDNALSEICTILSQCKLSNNKRKSVKPKDLSCNRALYKECQGRQVSMEEREAIMKLANDLSFPERFHRPTVENITSALKIYIRNDGNHPDDAPMYIGSGLLFETDETFLALSVFGPTAPSFYTVGGEKKDIPPPGKPDPLSVVDSTTKKPVLHVVPYTMKSIKTAMSDLYKVMKDRAIFVLPRERAGPSRTTQFTGKARDLMWTGLRESIGERSFETSEKKKDPSADKKDVGKGKEVAYADDVDFD